MIPEESRLLTSPSLPLRGPWRYTVTTKPCILTFMEVGAILSFDGLTALGSTLRWDPGCSECTVFSLQSWTSQYAVWASVIVCRVHLFHLYFSLMLQMAENSVTHEPKFTQIQVNIHRDISSSWTASLRAKSILTLALGSPENSNTPRNTGKHLGFLPHKPQMKGWRNLISTI